jgi:hypothetical protein
LPALSIKMTLVEVVPISIPKSNDFAIIAPSGFA